MEPNSRQFGVIFLNMHMDKHTQNIRQNRKLRICVKFYPGITSPVWVWIKKKKNYDKATLFILESHLGLKCHHYSYTFVLGHGHLHMCLRDEIFPRDIGK